MAYDIETGLDDGYTATANTGKQDSGGVWGSGLLSWATGLGNIATNVVNATKNPPKPVTQTPAVAGTTNWKPILIGAGVLLLVGVVFFGFMRRK